MLTRLLPFCSLLCFLLSCTAKNRIPKDVLPPDKMGAVMKDLMLADEFVTGYIWKNDTAVNRFEESIHLYEKIFRIHHISRDQFQKSLAYYRNHPKQMKTLLDSLHITMPPQPERKPLLKPGDSTLIPRAVRPIE